MKELDLDKSKSKSILLLHVYLVNNWREITQKIIEKSPHQDIAVHLCFDLRAIPFLWNSYWYLKKLSPRIKWFFFSSNRSGLSEFQALTKFRKNLNFKDYSILTYAHTKGVTKPNNKNVQDWRALMEYFIFERFDLMVKAFSEGYALYGVNLMKQSEVPSGQKNFAFKHAPYIFRGNFVSLNLDLLRENFLNTEIPSDYFGVEGFWGNLIGMEKAYCPHNSRINQYENPYPPSFYKSDIKT